MREIKTFIDWSMQMLLLSLFILLMLSQLTYSSSSTYNVTVENTHDFSTNLTSCSPSNIGAHQCNLRSAFATCLSKSGAVTKCTITLPSSTINFNASYGPLATQSSGLQIEIIGNNATIERISTGTSQRFLVCENSGNTTKLTLMSLRLYNFGHSTEDGGAIYVNGRCSLNINDVSFHSNTGNNGGVVYFGGKNNSITVQNSYLVNNIAKRGGALYFDDYVEGSYQNVSIHNGTALQNGGGIYISQTAAGLIVQNMSLSGCSSTYEGGAVYVADNASRVTLRSLQISESTSKQKSGGGIAILSNTTSITVDSSTFSSNSANFGGGLFVHESNSYATFTNLVFYDCYILSTGSDGGAFYIYDQNEYFNISNIKIYSSRAINDAGGIYIRHKNKYFTMSKIHIYNSTAGTNGGGLKINDYNDNFIVNGLIIEYCSAGNGGALFIYEYNTFFTFTNIQLTHSLAGQGGGAYIYTGNTNFAFTDFNISDCKSTNDGGGLYYDYQNSYFIFERLYISACSAGHSGGAIYGFKSNASFIYLNSFITNCYSESDGGCLSLSESSDLYMKNITVYDCTSKGGSGGGVAFGSDNTNVYIENSRFHNCSASNGGGLYFYDYSSNVRIINSSISWNTATENGGGIYAGLANVQLMIGSSTIKGNAALQAGGGIYLVAENNYFALLDYQQIMNYQVLESEHYASSSYTYSQNYSISGAYGYVLTFDASTYISGGGNSLEISSLTIDDAGMPGLTAPSLVLNEPSFTIKYSCYALCYYGFKVYIYPLFYDIVQPTIIESNSASEIGGGLFMFKINNFPVISNVKFISNYAKDGGAFTAKSDNVGAYFQGVTFTNNQCQLNGGALNLLSGQYGYSFYNCNFTGNSANSYGGAVSLTSGNGEGLFNSDQNMITFQKCYFDSNSAVQGGGAFYFDTKNEVNLLGCTIISSNASGGAGGAFMLSAVGNVLNISSGSFLLDNYASTEGGAIYAGEHNDMYISDSEASNNTAGDGGFLFAYQMNLLSFSGNINIAYNKALSGFGGGIALLSSSIWDLTGNLLSILMR